MSTRELDEWLQSGEYARLTRHRLFPEEPYYGMKCIQCERIVPYRRRDMLCDTCREEE
ncbi:hypothetical protein LCGC14_1603920 [marine sediment metagenome]|uniref:Uncharacterized protein n=1 Tax=marine sediment metagenome TaxID=412755 RepID=A0A0F9IAD9_9ZZZZ